jgi:hypothetical protein
MRHRLAVALALVGLAGAQDAHALEQTAPAPGTTLYTDRPATFTFTATADEQARWPDASIQFQRPGGRNFGTSTATGEGQIELDDLFLIEKFGTVPGGSYSWQICLARNTEQGPCTPLRALHVRYRLPALDELDAEDVTVFAAQLRAPRLWASRSQPDGQDPEPRCRKQTRTASVCRISWYTGDLITDLRVAITTRRDGVPVRRMRITGRLVDEYCLVVQKRPTSRCVDPLKPQTREVATRGDDSDLVDS